MSAVKRYHNNALAKYYTYEMWLRPSRAGGRGGHFDTSQGGLAGARGAAKQGILPPLDLNFLPPAASQRPRA